MPEQSQSMGRFRRVLLLRDLWLNLLPGSSFCGHEISSTAISSHRIFCSSRAGLNAENCDFGFARYLGAASLAETACGSPLYMAPEVLRRETYNAKADLWSVGCVMFEMLAKETPFTGFDQTELLRNVENGKCASMPPGVRVSEACASLLRGLLRQDQCSGYHFGIFRKPLRNSREGCSGFGRLFGVWEYYQGEKSWGPQSIIHLGVSSHIYRVKWYVYKCCRRRRETVQKRTERPCTK